MNEHHLHYSMLIEWSEEDQVYLVTLPEWATCTNVLLAVLLPHAGSTSSIYPAKLVGHLATS